MTEKAAPARKENTASRAEALITPVANQLGLSVWNVEFAKRGPDNYLTVTIDKPDGVTIDDCEALHRAIDAPLDEADFIESAYMLEVSSPGIERELTRPEHFEWAAGSETELRTYAPVNGARTLRGILVSHTPEALVLRIGDTELTVERKNVSLAKTVFDFGNI